jgi:hypothetical protein
MVGFALSHIQPPSPLYIQRDDVLVIQASTSQSAEVITITGRLLLAPTPRGGQPDAPSGAAPALDLRNSNIVQPILATVSPQNTRIPRVVTIPLAEGYLLSLASLAASAWTRGQTFVRATIVRGSGVSTQPSQVLFADYVTQAFGAAFPNGRVTSPVEGPGWLTVRSSAVPGAGLNPTLTVPTNARWRIQSVFTQLVTNATAGNRDVTLVLAVGATQVGAYPAAVHIPASTTALITGGGISAYTPIITADVQIPMPPDLALSWTSGGGAGSISTLTAGLLATDAYGAINALVEEWLDNV